MNWDLVVFDEYHFGAWHDTAKELFEGEDDTVAKKEATLEYASALAGVNEDLEHLSEAEADFLPVTTRAYLYLSGTPFRALATGEFIEEQIFNWTYTDEQRAKAEFATEHPGQWNPYSALPQMRLLTYQMPDELLAIGPRRPSECPGSHGAEASPSLHSSVRLARPTRASPAADGRGKVFGGSASPTHHHHHAPGLASAATLPEPSRSSVAASAVSAATATTGRTRCR